MTLVLKNLPSSAGDVRDAGSSPGSGRCPAGGHGNPLQNSCPENSMDRGAWRVGYRPWGPRELDVTECLIAKPLLLTSSVILRHCRLIRGFVCFLDLDKSGQRRKPRQWGAGVNNFLCGWVQIVCRSHLWPHFCFHFGHSESFNNHRGIKDPA